MTTSDVIHKTIIKNNKTSLINSPLHNEFSKSSTKRIYESVFRIIDFEEPESLSFSLNDTNEIKLNSFISDENILSHLYQKMKLQGAIDHYPILKICCEKINPYQHSDQFILTYNKLYQLDLEDIIEVFSRFGDLNKIIFTLDSKFAYVFYNTFHTAYISMKLFDNLTLPGKMAKLHVEWANPMEYQSLVPHFGTYLNSINWKITYKYCSIKIDLNANSNINAHKQNKLTCRYEIQIQNQKDFQVARRIIGSKGCHMKKIIEESLQFSKRTEIYQNNPKNFQNINELLKLRLRGKGSGYKEGPEQQQSQQSLHLCVSAKDEICFQFACDKVEQLLEDVYEQYYEYTIQQGRPIKLVINKNSLSTQTVVNVFYQTQMKQSCTTNNNDSQYYSDEAQPMRINPSRICELLQLRNKARRELNFLEADRIRNFLRNCGVCLIDEKGRRGRATEVTTWKYVC